MEAFSANDMPPAARAISADVTSAAEPASWPLVVDLDGTLTPTDTLWESMLRLVRSRPWLLFALFFWAAKGRFNLKQQIADRLVWAGEHVPVNADLLAYLREQAASGRRVVLATAAHHRIAHTVAERVGVFDQVLASRDGRNLKGVTKLEAIRAEVGVDFVYAGDSSADLPIWAAARAAVLVDASSAVRRSVVDGGVAVERDFTTGSIGLRGWLKGLRIHQWTKNALLFVPLLTSAAFVDAMHVAQAITAFVAFGLIASATYIINDLADLDSDRQHPRKRNRPFASAGISIPAALVACTGLLVAGAFLAAATNWRFGCWMAVYVVLTLTYSLRLKRHMVADVLALASLYTLRILAGAAAIQVQVSTWLLAFSAFIFFSLALIKRCSELVTMERAGREGAAGRGYIVYDLRVLWPLGAASAMSAVVVFGLFISSEETRHRYSGAPDALWLAALALLYWITRLWIKTSRGEMHDDPIVYALRDRTSVLTIVAILGAFVLARVWPY